MKKVMKVTLGVLFASMLGTGSVTLAAQYSDVEGHWAMPTIDWASENQIINGYEDGSFKPDKQVTEAEFLKILVAAYESPPVISELKHWADNYYSFAETMYYPTTGANDVSKRGNVISRVRVAELVSATQGVNYTGRDSIRYLLWKGLAKGKNPNDPTVDGYDAEGNLTRAEAVQFIRNVKERGKPQLTPRPFGPSDTSIIPDETKTKQEQVQQTLHSAIGPGYHVWVNGDSVVVQQQARGIAGIDFYKDGHWLLTTSEIKYEADYQVVMEMVKATGVAINNAMIVDMKTVVENRKAISKQYGGVIVNISHSQFEIAKLIISGR